MMSLSVSNSPRSFLFYLIVIFTFINGNNAYPADTSVDDTKPNDHKSGETEIGFDKVQQENSMAAIYVMYGISLISLQIGSLCALYVILRTLLRWIRANSTLNMAHKLPFYIALSGKYIERMRNSKLTLILIFIFLFFILYKKDLCIYILLTINLVYAF